MRIAFLLFYVFSEKIYYRIVSSLICLNRGSKRFFSEVQHVRSFEKACLIDCLLNKLEYKYIPLKRNKVFKNLRILTVR